jgi:hypothetical protein
MTDEQQSELLALDAATCSIEELNRAALLIAGFELKYSDAVPTLLMWRGVGVDAQYWCMAKSPISDSDWAAGFAMDALMTMQAQLFPIDTSPFYVCGVTINYRVVNYYPLDRTATGRTAMCECIHRARLVHWQSEEK